MASATSSKSASTYGCNRAAEAIGYISIHRDHDKAYFGENEIRSVISGE